MNVLGRIVLALLLSGLFFFAVAVIRGQIDGASFAAVTLILLALATTVWAAINRKRTQP